MRPISAQKNVDRSLGIAGELGWIQVANFVVTGALAFAGALGLRLALPGQRGGKAGPILAGLYESA